MSQRQRRCRCPSFAQPSPVRPRPTPSDMLALPVHSSPVQSQVMRCECAHASADLLSVRHPPCKR